MDRQFADVVATDEVVDYLRQCPTAAVSRQTHT